MKSLAARGVLEAVVRHPRWTIALILLMTVIAAIPIAGLDVSASRRALIDSSQPYQKRLLELDRRFPAADPIIIVVSGGRAHERRAALRRFQRELESQTRFAGRIRVRVHPLIDGALRWAAEPRLVAFLAEQHARFSSGELSAILRAAFDTVTSGLPSGKPNFPLKSATMAVHAIDDEIQGHAGLDRLSRHLLPIDERIDAAGYLRLNPEHHFALVYPAYPEDTLEVQRPAIAAIRDAAVEHFRSPLKVWVTGSDAISVDERSVIRSGIVRSSVAAGLGILLLLMIALRSIRRAILAVIPMALAIVWSYGFIALVFGTQNLVTANFTAVLMGLGIDFAIHLLARCLEERERQSAIDATRTGWRLALSPILAGAITSALAFMTTTTTQFSAFAQMGWASAFGLLAMVALTLLVFPPLLLLGNALEGRSVISRPRRLTPRLAALLKPAAWPVVVVAAVACAASLWGVGRIGFNVRHFDFLPDRTESAQGLAILEETGHSPFGAMVPVASLADADKLAQRLRAETTVGRVESPSDLLPESIDIEALNQSLRAKPTPTDTQRQDTPEALGQTLRGLARALQPLAVTDDLREFRSALVNLARTLLSLSDAERTRWHKLVESTSRQIDSTLERARALASGQQVRLPGSQHHRFAAVQGDGYAVYVSPAGDLWRRSDAEAFLAMLDRVAPDAVGAGLVLYRHSRYIVDGFRRAAAIAWILVFVAVWLSLKRFTDAVLALVPVSVGLIWLLGAMSAIGRSFDHANVVVLPIILGIGVDAGVHLMHRARESHTTLPTLLGRTGTAISLSAATTAVGFGALMLAEYGAMRSFGSLMLIGLGAVWLAALAVLPALLVITRRVGSGQDHRTGR